MKALLAVFSLVGGFVMSLGMFGAGLAFAAWFLIVDHTPEPQRSVDVADLWTTEARAVDTSAQDLERLPAAPLSPAAPPPAVVTEAAVDPVTTAALEPAAGGPEDHLSLQHARWCAARYRSYRPADDSYLSYSGEVRPCISPFNDGRGDMEAELEAFLEADDTEPAMEAYMPVDSAASQRFGADVGDDEIFMAAPQYAVRSGDEVLLVDDLSASPRYASDAEAGDWLDADHVAYCFARYRSYRPEDNSYQPYGGGPRRQCR